MMTQSPVPYVRRKLTRQIDAEAYQAELERIRKKPLDGAVQLSFFDSLAGNTPAAYTHLLEFFDSVPKFVLTPHTSLRKGGGLALQHFEFSWGDVTCSVTITPVVVETKDPETRQSIRKEVIPGPREETIYRVLKKMATDPGIERKAKERSVIMRFSLHQLRLRLKQVGHEYKVIEIREALEVLNRSPLSITVLSSKKKLYSGNYIGLTYVSDETDPTGERSLVEVSFNELAVAAVTAQIFDRIHYQRLMSLSPLAAWIYELLTRNFRQAGVDHGFKLTLTRVMRESGLPARKDRRSNVRSIRTALDELVDRGVLAMYPKLKEEIIYEVQTRQKRGRPAMKDVIWTIFPHTDVVKDIREDNAVQESRRGKRIAS